ncbi:MAG: T9SS type A sorting domain-containing protein, partial [Saprospiraceae bacterium]
VNGLTEVSFDLDLSGYLTHIDDIQVNNQGLFVKGKKGALDYLIQINEQLHVINETAMDMPDLGGPFTFTYYSDRVYGSTTAGVAEYRMSYHYIDANPIRFVDVSLDTIWVDSVFYYPHEMHLPANLYLLARVTNHSPDIIHSLTFHYSDTPFFFCDPGVYPFFVDGLSIPPGETGIVPFTAWSWELAENKPFFRTYHVEHANHHLDDNTADNHFQLSYFLSAVEPVVENRMSIWPNPFYDYLETSEDFDSLKMYNNLGNVVSTGINRLDNLRSLAPGTYYVQGVSDHKLFFSRVIKIN